MTTIHEATLAELIGDPIPEDEPSRVKLAPNGRRKGSTSGFPYGKRSAAALPRNIVPEWADKRPGSHPMLPARPPGRK